MREVFVYRIENSQGEGPFSAECLNIDEAKAEIAQKFGVTSFSLLAATKNFIRDPMMMPTPFSIGQGEIQDHIRKRGDKLLFAFPNMSRLEFWFQEPFRQVLETFDFFISVYKVTDMGDLSSYAESFEQCTFDPACAVLFRRLSLTTFKRIDEVIASP